MSTIIAGLFATIAQAEDAHGELQAAGIAPDRISIFILNPAGQHALYPIGGDEDADPGASHVHDGAISGACIGASTGLSLGAVTAAATGAGPAVAIAVAAAAAGAYAGSLVGTLHKLGEPPDEPARAAAGARHAGVMVAVNAETTTALSRALALLQAHGAHQIERATGEWRNGQWLDFDPRVAPDLIHLDAVISRRPLDFDSVR